MLVSTIFDNMPFDNMIFVSMPFDNATFVNMPFVIKGGAR